jgi:hypothetical protein
MEIVVQEEKDIEQEFVITKQCSNFPGRNGMKKKGKLVSKCYHLFHG